MIPSRLQIGLAACLVLAGFAPAAAQVVGYDQGYYRPVAPVPYAGPPCGHYGGRPCAVAPSRDMPDDEGGGTYEAAQVQDRRGDHDGAIRTLRRAAARGDVRAQTALGRDLVTGHGVARDVPQGLALLNAAVARGHAAAEFQLGSIYDNGDVGREDPARAARLMRAAADQRYWQAEYWMGIASAVGRGAPRSRGQAIAYLDRAAGDGQAGMPQLMASYLRATRAEPASIDALDSGFHAWINSQYRAAYNPGGASRGGGGLLNPNNPLCKGMYIPKSC